MLVQVPTAQLVLIFGLLIVLALIISPVPTWLLDVLIALNFVVSLILLLTAVQIKNPLEFATFPSLLLFTTLFRLALNVASTKLILLEAHAGEIIEAFGKLVVGGSVAVGLVVFLIIVVVQFIVVAKGAERVAEVGARFTLDAMPGKQMSIDADLRAGIINGDQARVRRAELGRESQLHGAMDGAMKFVKGDTIAGIFIAFINITAGIAIGVGYHEMPLAEAANLYTVLTVGDGVVSQLPSLFVAMAAGLVITRVTGGEEDKPSLASNIGVEVGRYPIASITGGGVLVLLGMLPGFPILIFVGLGAVPIYFGVKTIRTTVKERKNTPFAMTALSRTGSQIVPLFGSNVSGHVALIEIVIDTSLQASISGQQLNFAMTQARLAFDARTGIPFPGINIEFRGLGATNCFQISCQGIVVVRGQLPVGSNGAEKSSSVGSPTVPQLIGYAPMGEKWSAEWHLAAAVISAIQRSPEQYVGLQETQFLLNKMNNEYPDLIAELQREVPTVRVAEIFRRLVEERVSIKPLRELIESIINWAPREREIINLIEFIRIDLGKFIAAQYAQTDGLLRAVTLSGELEEELRNNIRQTNLGIFLALDPETSEALTERLAQLVNTPAADIGGNVDCICCAFDVRRHVRRLVERKLPITPVLSYQELGSFVDLRTVAVVNMQVDSLSEEDESNG
jgi:type III secretion protein V